MDTREKRDRVKRTKQSRPTNHREGDGDGDGDGDGGEGREFRMVVGDARLANNNKKRTKKMRDKGAKERNT